MTDQRKAFGDGPELPAEPAADANPVFRRHFHEIDGSVVHGGNLGEQAPA
jgi:hypothetical protein